MILTDIDARTKWCPFAMAQEPVAIEHPIDGHMIGYIPVATNRIVSARMPDPVGRPAMGCMCIGHHCMAWDWVEAPQPGRERLGFCSLMRQTGG